MTARGSPHQADWSAHEGCLAGTPEAWVLGAGYVSERVAVLQSAVRRSGKMPCAGVLYRRLHPCSTWNMQQKAMVRVLGAVAAVSVGRV